MWNTIKNLALELLHEDPRYRGETEASLLQWVLETGYAGALEPHQRVRDLIYVYAASLRNAGGPGPRFEPFAAMVAAAAESFIGDNVVQEVTLPVLAQHCSAYLDIPGVDPLAAGGTRDYRNQLRQMAGGDRIPGFSVLQSCLESVVAFIQFLHREHGGSASNYHQAFTGACAETAPNPFVVEKYREIAAFPRVGVAVGMNFFKDSQVPAFRNSSLDHLRGRHVGWFVKPDKHVLRLTLHATGRTAGAGIDPGELFRLPDSLAVRTYGQAQGGPYQLDQGQPGPERGAWYCVEDIHRFAAQEGVAPLGFDRLLYLVGSGKYRDPVRPLVVSQSERYRRFVQAIDEFHAGGHFAVDAGARVVDVPAVQHDHNPMLAAAPDRPPAVDCFYASINDSQAALELVEQVAVCCEDLHAQVHHTRTNDGDLRVRADRLAPNPREQNVITMAWVPTKGYFACKALPSPEECVQQGLPPEGVRPNTATLSSRLDVRPGIDDEAFLSIVSLSIQRFREQ
jgi:hypothetical protein